MSDSYQVYIQSDTCKMCKLLDGIHVELSDSSLWMCTSALDCPTFNLMDTFEGFGSDRDDSKNTDTQLHPWLCMNGVLWACKNSVNSIQLFCLITLKWKGEEDRWIYNICRYLIWGTFYSIYRNWLPLHWFS